MTFQDVNNLLHIILGQLQKWASRDFYLETSTCGTAKLVDGGIDDIGSHRGTESV